jgi:CRP/FNR family cyclic AMP-dependent transcriptional regulator
MPEPQRVAPLLDVDPDLGQFLEGSRAEDARRQLLVRVRRLAVGPWNTARLTVADPGHLGLLVLDGVLAREVLAADVISTELIGGGELLRPWQLSPDPALLRVSVRWSVLSEARVAVLDRRLAGYLAAYPEILSLLVERMTARTQRLAVAQAISQLNRVDQRLLTLFWHLAERWGRMTSDGVAIPLTLSHRMLSQLVGARRPTVSTALGELARDQRVVRQDDGSWLLRGEPVGEPAAKNARLIPPRRRLIATAAVAEPVPAAPGTDATGSPLTPDDRAQILMRLQRAKEDSQRLREELRGGYATTNMLFARAREAREAREARGVGGSRDRARPPRGVADRAPGDRAPGDRAVSGRGAA